MSGCPSQQLWRRPLTTAFRRVGGQKRTKPHEDRRPPVLRLFQLFEDEPGGVRPGPVKDPQPQEWVQRHTVDQIVETFVPV